MRKVFNKIKEYYLSNTELGRREVALNLDCNNIQLTSDFPYYSEGIYSIDIKDKDYYFYVDLSFILYYFDKVLYYDGFLKFITSRSAFEIPISYYLIVISNNNALKELSFRYDNRILYNIDMTSHKILLDSSNDSTILPLTESVYLNWYNSGISLQFKNFSTYYSLLTTKSLDENLSDFSKYFIPIRETGLGLSDNYSNSVDIRLLVFNSDLSYLKDFISNLWEIIDKSTLSRYNLIINFVLEKSEKLNLTLTIDNWIKSNKDNSLDRLTILDYPEFDFIKELKDNFSSLFIKI